MQKSGRDLSSAAVSLRTVCLVGTTNTPATTKITDVGCVVVGTINRLLCRLPNRQSGLLDSVSSCDLHYALTYVFCTEI